MKNTIGIGLKFANSLSWRLVSAQKRHVLRFNLVGPSALQEFLQFYQWLFVFLAHFWG